MKPISKPVGAQAPTIDVYRTMLFLSFVILPVLAWGIPGWVLVLVFPLSVLVAWGFHIRYRITFFPSTLISTIAFYFFTSTFLSAEMAFIPSAAYLAISIVLLQPTKAS